MSLTGFRQRNFVADFLQAKCDFARKKPFCVFDPPWELRAMYDDHIRHIGKRVVDFLVLID